METLRGIASNVAGTAAEFPGRTLRSKRIVHTSKFKIDGRKVSFESTRPQAIRDGDQMVVAGTVRGDTLNALAYRNLTTRVDGHQSWFLWLVVGVLFPSVGLMLPIHIFLDGGAGVKNWVGLGIVTVIWLCIFCLIGGIGLLTGVQTLQAVNAVRKEAP